jgi:Zn-finger nucleic acid-binding protein
VIYRDSFPMCLSCADGLAAIRVGPHTFARCPRCFSAFIDHATLRAMWAEMAPGKRFPAYEGRMHGHGVRPCPRCSEPMRPVRLLAVPLDLCQDDGVWFDPRELEVALAGAALPLEDWLETFTDVLRGMR